METANNVPKYVFSFEEGDGKDKKLLGGKGANLCEMTQIGLNVPPGFVISTVACLAYLDKNALPEGVMDQVRDHMKALEAKTGKGFGNPDNPLLVSVRSGSAMSMPGMMDTILNLGLTAKPQGEIRHTTPSATTLTAVHPALRKGRPGRPGQALRPAVRAGQGQGPRH
jgi:pyruvate,orthophosphate dikinase